MKNMNKIKLFFMLAVGLRVDHFIQASSSADPKNCVAMDIVDDLKLEDLSYEEVVSLMKTDFQSFMSLFHESNHEEGAFDYSCFDPELKAGFYLLKGVSYKNFLRQFIDKAKTDANDSFMLEDYFYPDAHAAALKKIVCDMADSYYNAIKFAIKNNITDLHAIENPLFLYIFKMAPLNTMFDSKFQSHLMKGYEDSNLLHDALRQDNKEVIKLLIPKFLEDGATLNSDDNLSLQTPLHIAITKGNIPAIKLLISRLIQEGADLTLKDNHHQAPLDLAMHYSDRSIDYENDEIVVLLFLEIIKNLTDEDLLGEKGQHLLHKAIHSKCNLIIESLIARLVTVNADLNLPDQNGNSPLHNAMYTHNNKAIKLLITELAKVNADLNLLDSRHQTPLHAAILCNNLEAVELLLPRLIHAQIDLSLLPISNNLRIARLMNNAIIAIESFKKRLC